MNNIVLYTTHCPQCIVLEKKLKAKNIQYTEVTDIDIMQSKNITFAPALEVDGEVLNFVKANKYINSY